MTGRIIKRAEAREDLIEHFAFIGQSSLEAARRFLVAAEAAFEQLAQMPRMGSPHRFDNPALTGMRQWSIPGFDNYLIFYLPTDEGIEVVRVLHGARDMQRIFQR